MRPRPGEVWLADPGLAAKTRSVVVASRDDTDPTRVLVIYVPLTSQERGSRYEMKIPKQPFLHSEGVANVQGIASLPHRRLKLRLGMLPPEITGSIKDALRFALDLEP